MAIPLSEVALPIVLAVPYLLAPLVAGWRGRGSRSLDAVDPTPPDDAPMISVIVPARNEARTIERCVRSLLASTWPRLEVIAVDDHSTDGTGAILRRIAREDARLVVLDAPELPADWFGKQWACATGAAAASGTLLLFTDADTAHAPDSLTRAANAITAWGADLLTVGGHQELDTFWEKVVQPQVLGLIALRYGGTEAVNRSARATDKIANGQFIFVRRAAYDAIGGHAAVRATVVEDLALAQRFFRDGYTTILALGERQFSVRMYTSLGELMRGWEKNVYAGGRDAMFGGRVGRALFPALLPLHAAGQLLPPLMLAAAASGLAGPSWLIWSATATGALALFWAGAAARLRIAPAWGLLFPLGAAVFLAIIVRAIARGTRVRWKDREYQSR